eukprot:6183582-Pleurochrysis_carterae.AAC.3
MISCPPRSTCVLNSPRQKAAQAGASSGGKATSSWPQHTCTWQLSGGPCAPASASACATLLSARASARRSAIIIGSSHSRHASD